MTVRRRVLHVVHNMDYGGLERLVGALTSLTDATRFENHVLTLGEFGRFARGLEASAVLHRVESIPQVSMVWPRRLIQAIRAAAPDVAHTHSGVWYKAALAARLAGVGRVVHTDHGRQYPDPRMARWLDGIAAGRTDVVVAVSDSLARHLAERVVKGRAPIRVIPNGVDTDRFRPHPVNGAVRQELGLVANAPVIGSIGRLVPIKAYDMMVQAFAILLRDWGSERPRPSLVVVGDGPERPRLEAMIADLGLTGAAHLAGWRADVEQLYASFDVFTLASWSEGTSLGLLEAMSTGVCPVVTDVGGSAAVLGNSLRHRLVPSGDAAALAAGWREALLHAEERSVDATMARQRVEQTFGLPAMIKEYERIYCGEC